MQFQPRLTSMGTFLAADRSNNRNEGEESLLQWVDVEGSAGSLDTSVSDTSSNASHQSATVSLEVASVEDAGDDGEQPQMELRAYHGIGLPRDEGTPKVAAGCLCIAVSAQLQCAWCFSSSRSAECCNLCSDGCKEMDQ